MMKVITREEHICKKSFPIHYHSLVTLSLRQYSLVTEKHRKINYQPTVEHSLAQIAVGLSGSDYTRNAWDYGAEKQNGFLQFISQT
jgi:hypothetical protein